MTPPPPVPPPARHSLLALWLVQFTSTLAAVTVVYYVARFYVERSARKDEQEINERLRQLPLPPGKTP